MEQVPGPPGPGPLSCPDDVGIQLTRVESVRRAFDARPAGDSGQGVQIRCVVNVAIGFSGLQGGLEVLVELVEVQWSAGGGGRVHLVEADFGAPEVMPVTIALVKHGDRHAGLG